MAVSSGLIHVPTVASSRVSHARTVFNTKRSVHLTFLATKPFVMLPIPLPLGVQVFGRRCGIGTTIGHDGDVLCSFCGVPWHSRDGLLWRLWPPNSRNCRNACY